MDAPSALLRESPRGAGVAVAPRATAAAAPRRLELRRWIGAIACLDAIVAVVAAASGIGIRYGVAGTPLRADLMLAVSMPAVWVVAMAVVGSYDGRFLVAGAEEFRRVANGALWVVGGVALAAFVSNATLSRECAVVTLLLASVLTLIERYGVRKVIHGRLRRGFAVQNALVVGVDDETGSLIDHIERNRYLGMAIAGVARPTQDLEVTARIGGERAVFDRHDLLEAARWLHADTIVVAGGRSLGQGELRRVSWLLEGSGVDLVVAPAMTDVAGPRLIVRPVDGLPLLHLEEPQLTGMRRVVKGTMDRAGAVLALLLGAPLFALAALAVLVVDGRPLFFRQERVGQHGRTFHILKFRSMVVGAESLQASLAHLNENDGVLFKMRTDPRITRSGRWLRRWSLDELPQLLNVLRGEMSLVGPRPPLPSEVERYSQEVRRRFLVKPGITGMWQVNGRSSLPWNEAVRLDLYYVENWSVALDVVVLLKTIGAVFRRHGAY